MATVLLVRHGRTAANTAAVLAGRQPGVRLDERGHEQAARVAARLGTVRLARVVTSPLLRCRQTARPIVSTQPSPPTEITDRDLLECDYGEWTGRSLKDLAKDSLWPVVQSQPSGVVFPGGESLAAVQARATASVRRHDREVEAEHGPGAVWVAVSHGDVIKAVLADLLGTHLDHFQRIVADPASVSIVRLTPLRPFVLGMNTHDGDLSWLVPPRPRRTRRRRADSEATVGGGAGPTA